jgi:hypothetical protein
MKIWKWNCWRKVPLEMLCLVVEWNQTHQTLYQKNLLRKPSTLTNQIINQTGTYGPVMLRSWRKSNQNLLRTSIYLKTFQDRKLKGRIQIISRLIWRRIMIQKIITSKMRLQLWFQENLGLINLLSQDFYQDTIKTTMLSCYSRSRKSNHNIIGINKEPG